MLEEQAQERILSAKELELSLYKQMKEKPLIKLLLPNELILTFPQPSQLQKQVLKKETAKVFQLQNRTLNP
jgi:hypothetical protein